MGNNNTVLQHDTSPAVGINFPNDTENSVDDLAIKNISKVCPTKSRKFSPAIQQLVLELTESAILPLANEIGVTQESIRKISKSANITIDTGERNSNIDGSPPTSSSNFCRAASGSSKDLKPNIAALINSKVVEDRDKKYPTIFRYSGNKNQVKEVFLSGTFNNWQKVKMSKSANDFVAIFDLKEGDHEYRYSINNGENSVYKAVRNNATKNNCCNETTKRIMRIRKEDFDVFQALDMDSFSVSNSRRKHSLDQKGDEDTFQNGVRSYSDDDGDDEDPKMMGYGQETPSFSKQLYSSASPPNLPPHLLHFMLNRKDMRNNRVNVPFPELLPKPCHALLTHLYAMAIKEDMLILSSTQRYHKKYVTTILYRPNSTPASYSNS